MLKQRRLDLTYNCIPALDIEVNNYGRSAGEITDRCLKFLNRFKELSGIDCMIYTGGYFGRDNLDGRIKGYKGWIAHYGVDYPMDTGFPWIVGLPYHTPELTIWIQSRLGLNPDGIFGPDTEREVIKWRRNHGLNADGLAGYETIKSLALA